MDNIIVGIFQIAILLFSVVVHEVSHGFMALKLGDQTAKDAGRLTLNPIPHLDPVGSIFLPLLLILTGSGFVIGWAKPVPYNPMALYKDPKYGPLKVALAGPLSNFILAILVGLFYRLFAAALNPAMGIFLTGVVFINVLLGIFNLIPIPPLDGSKILTLFLPPKYSYALQGVGLSGLLFVVLFLFLFGNVVFGLSAGLTELIIGQGALF